MAILSVRLSVRHGPVQKQPSDIETPGESLASNEVILVRLGEEIPLERGHQRGVPPLEIFILPLLAHLA